MNKWLITTCVVGGIAIASVTWAEPGDRGNGQRQEQRGGDRQHGGQGRGIETLANNPDLAREAGVTDEQIAALKAALYEQRKGAIKLRSDAQLARLEVRNLMQADTVDKAAVMAAVDAAGQIATDLRKSQIAFLLQAKEIVGKAALQKLREHARERRGSQGPGGNQRQGEGRGPGFGGNDSPERPATAEADAPWMEDEMMPPDEMEEDLSAI